MASKTPELKKIIALVSNLFTSNFNEGAIRGVVKYIQKMNMDITNVKDGIVLVLQYDCHILNLLIRIIDEYTDGFTKSFPDEIVEYYENSRNKMIIMIVAYLANYNNYFATSLKNAINDIDLYLHHNLNIIRLRYDIIRKSWREDAANLREWYINEFLQAGFIMWNDPIIGDIDDYIAYLDNKM